MKLPLGIAKKILRLASGEILPKSQIQHPFVERMIEEGVIHIKASGRRKKHLFIREQDAIYHYLKNLGINDLSEYIDKLSSEKLTRAEAVKISSDSKLKSIRTFRGFPINCYRPIKARLNDMPLLLEPSEGLFSFVYDFEYFVPNEDVTIIGVENPENFRYVTRQAYLFQNVKPLFVSRYPQSKDLINWLLLIPNMYLHFGDFDFEGINIYYNEFEKHLKKRATFFVPDNIEDMLRMYGNRELYDRQFSRAITNITDERIFRLVSLMHKHKKCLEQEVFIEKETV